jgi:diguanylate cyclase (GGDEF)-like protein
LIAVSRRLRRALRPQDLLARLGGDEFAVLLPHLRHASDAATVADKLVQAVSTPFMVDAQSLQIGASIGFSVARGSSAKLEEMVLKADAKLYEAKRAGRNGYRGDTTEEADQPG